MFWEFKENDFYGFYEDESNEFDQAVWTVITKSYDRGYYDASKEAEKDAVVNFDETYNNAYNEGFSNAIEMVNDFRCAIGLIKLPKLFTQPLAENWNEAEWAELLGKYDFKVGDEIVFSDGNKYIIYRVDYDYYGYLKIFYVNDMESNELIIQMDTVIPTKTGRSFSEMPIMLEKMKGVE